MEFCVFVSGNGTTLLDVRRGTSLLFVFLDASHAFDHYLQYNNNNLEGTVSILNDKKRWKREATPVGLWIWATGEARSVMSWRNNAIRRQERPMKIRN